ncbi:MAG: SAM-dependent methyltransferase [Rhodobacter sp.]|nr:SAM-dependent methyltransferase [Rhodobacter sp.]MCY4242109.1 SAM-dependent methyltransferase [Rhodobacter sp.]
MTPLMGLLADRISAAGPITVAEYMTECLLHPEHGYYMKGNPFGVSGDFTTAPEVSQMYGEIIGLALAQAWIDQGRQSPFVLAELGPGRGTCMADILRASRGVAGFLDAARVHLIEASESMRGLQSRKLDAKRITWLASVSDLPDAPLFLIASEFFDALPINQFVRTDSGWRERLIGLRDGALTFGLGETAPAVDLDRRTADTRQGDVVELRPSARTVIASVTSRLDRYGGAVLVIDYGNWRSLGDTLQAVKGHRNVDPLAEPGLADLSAHVDFEALADAAADVIHGPLTQQGVFLERLGITARANRLAGSLCGKALDEHIAAHRRLTHPQEMGSIFKVLGFTPRDAPRFPGLNR